MEGDAEYTRDELGHGLEQAEEAADAMMEVYESADIYDADKVREWTDTIRAAREKLEEESGLSHETRAELVDAISGLQGYTRAEMEREREYLRRDREPDFEDIADVKTAEEALEKLDTAAYVVTYLTFEEEREDLDIEERKRSEENMGERTREGS